MTKPFVLLQSRPEDEASDNEYQAFLHFGGLAPTDLERVRIEAGQRPAQSLAAYSGVLMGGGPANFAYAPAEKPADKPADAQADKPAEAPAEKPAEKPAESAAPADEQPGQATSFVPDNLVSEKTAMIVSPSGNIGCDLSAHYAGCGVLSYRSDGTYGRDEAGSPKWWFDLSSGGTPQLAGRSEGAFSLDQAFRGGGSSPQVVEYGQSVTFGSWVCSSEETGMTCRNTETGHGVFLSSGRYETF